MLFAVGTMHLLWMAVIATFVLLEKVAPAVLFVGRRSCLARASFRAERVAASDGIINFAFINGVRESAPILEEDPESRFVIRYFGAEVTFELEEPDDGGTDLTLTTRGFADEDQEEELLAGWLNVLFPMKAAVDHGVDLRNHDPSRTWDDGWADQ